MDQGLFVRRLLSVVEPLAVLAIAFTMTLAALAACYVITIVADVPLIPLKQETEFPLVWAGQGEPPPETLNDLRLRVEDRELADDVTVIDDEGAFRLVLIGALPDGFASEVAELLDATGFRRTAFETRRLIPREEIVREAGPLLLSIQGIVFLAVGLALLWFRVDRTNWPRAPWRPGNPVVWGLIGGFGAFLISLIVGFALNLLGFPVQEQDWVLELLQDRAALLGLIPWMVLLLPLSEEVFFRGYVFRFVSQRIGLRTGAVISALMFALVHFNPSGFPIYVGIGLVLAWVYVRSSSLVAPIIGHVIHNSIVLAIGVFTPR
jgi:membrane protease YdiL (CAAX protease family)